MTIQEWDLFLITGIGITQGKDKIMKENYERKTEPHWTDKHITFGYIAWDEIGAYPIGCYDTPEEAREALIDYAKGWEK